MCAACSATVPPPPSFPSREPTRELLHLKRMPRGAPRSPESAATNLTHSSPLVPAPPTMLATVLATGDAIGLFFLILFLILVAVCGHTVPWRAPRC